MYFPALKIVLFLLANFTKQLSTSTLSKVSGTTRNFIYFKKDSEMDLKDITQPRRNEERNTKDKKDSFYILNSVDTGHDDMIHDAEVDYYGLRLATCSSDNTIKVYNIKNGTHSLAADLKGHFGPVWQISWGHPKYGNLLASCSYDRKVIIWKEQNPGEWIKYYEYNNHDSSVNSVQWAPPEYGLMLACGSSDGSISVLTYQTEVNNWDAKKIPNAHTIGCNAVSWCPAIHPENTSEGNQSLTRRFVSGGCDNLVKIWKEAGDRWVEENKLEVHSDWVRDVAWAPSSGKYSS